MGHGRVIFFDATCITVMFEWYIEVDSLSLTRERYLNGTTSNPCRRRM
jgi:hypothetical protein